MRTIEPLFDGLEKQMHTFSRVWLHFGIAPLVGLPGA